MSLSLHRLCCFWWQWNQQAVYQGLAQTCAIKWRMSTCWQERASRLKRKTDGCILMLSETFDVPQVEMVNLPGWAGVKELAWRFHALKDYLIKDLHLKSRTSTYHVRVTHLSDWFLCLTPDIYPYSSGLAVSQGRFAMKLARNSMPSSCKSSR